MNALRLFRPIGRGKRFESFLFVTFFIASTLFSVCAIAQDQTLPGPEYDWGIMLLRDGKHDEALKQFASELRGGFKIATDRWIDSICFAAMLGETHYQMGHFPEALDSFDTAVRLAIQHSNWLTTVQNIPNPGAFTLKRVPWGDPNPGRGLIHVPEKFSILFGDINYGTKYQTGGVAMAPSLRSVRGAEIVRCTMLAIRRRAELLGPLGAGDDLNAQLMTQIVQTQRALAGSWLTAWLEMEVGLANLAANKPDEASAALLRGALINGSAHILTPVAYIELGKIQMMGANYEKAYNFFLEAAAIAFYFEDVELMEEAFRGLENAYAQRNPQMICPPLAPALEWARIKKLPMFYTNLQELRTDDFMRFKQAKQAAVCLADAEKTIARRPIALGTLGARLNYQRARIALLDPSPASQTLGMTSLAKMLQFMQFGSVWNFYLNQVDGRLLNGQMTSRKALECYKLLLREPTPSDWALVPMEALAVTMTRRPGTWENFFLCAIDMEKKEDALEISERARRAAYLQTLDFGGRMHALRQLLENSEADLTVTQRQRRRDILTEYPGYEMRSKKVLALQMKIRSMSLPVTEREKGVELTQALDEVSQLSREQEAILSAMVLDRRPIDILFPKVRTCAEIQASLPKGEAMLVYFAARNQMFVFLMNNERLTMWKIFDAGAGTGSSKKKKAGNTLTSLQTNYASLMKEIGLGGGNVRAQQLTETNWKTSAQRVMADLTKNSQANFSSADFSSLVIIPDRFTWYLPFEALQIQTSKGQRPTIAQFSVRYAPMASLGTPWKRTQLPKSPYTMLVSGKNSPGEKVLESFEAALERPVEFETKSWGGVQPGSEGTTSSIIATEFDKMFVFADLKNDDAASYGIFPMGIDYGAKTGTLGHWFLLPAGSPRLVFLAGMHTQCEPLLKKTSKRSGSSSSSSSKAAPPAVVGQEMFLTSMAFLANGVDTVVLPRWRLEGPSPWVISTYFLEQLPKNTTSAEAWRRTVLKFASEEIRLETEPRVAASDEITRAKGTHPFFWAGFMLIDSGSGSLRAKERLMSAEDEAEAEAEAGLQPPPAAVPAAPAVPEGPENPQPPENPAGNGPLAPLPPMGGGAAAVPMGGRQAPALE